MHLVLLGCPGAGKGTQASVISEKYGIAKISTGDMLRAAMNAGTSLGDRVAGIVNGGRLVPDDLMTELVQARIGEPDCQKGFLLDGFPRTLAQAKALEEITPLDAVIEIQVPDEMIIERLSGRRIHPQSGRVYHVKNQPPKVAGQDDITSEPLVQREDDTEATIRKRLAVYHEQTEPLIRYYDGHLHEEKLNTVFFQVDGTQDVNRVSEFIFKKLDFLTLQGEKHAQETSGDTGGSGDGSVEHGPRYIDPIR